MAEPRDRGRMWLRPRVGPKVAEQLCRDTVTPPTLVCVAPTQFRGRVRSPLRRCPQVEAALVARWESAQDEDLRSVLDAAWLVGISPGTITSRIRSGALPGTREAHGWRRIRTADLRPLVDQGLRQYGPSRDDP